MSNSHVFDTSYPYDRIDIIGHGPSDGIGIGAILKRLRPNCQIEIHPCFLTPGDLALQQSGGIGRLIVAWIDCKHDRRVLADIAKQIEAVSDAYPDLYIQGATRHPLVRGFPESNVSVADRYPYVEFYREFCWNALVEGAAERDSFVKLNSLVDPCRAPERTGENLGFLGEILGGIDFFNPTVFQKNARRLVEDLAKNLAFPKWSSSCIAAFREYLDRTEKEAFELINKSKKKHPANYGRRKGPWIFVVDNHELFPLLWSLDRAPWPTSLGSKLGVHPKELIVLAPTNDESGRICFKIWAEDKSTFNLAVYDLKKQGLYSDENGIAPDRVGQVGPTLRKSID